MKLKDRKKIILENREGQLVTANPNKRAISNIYNDSLVMDELENIVWNNIGNTRLFINFAALEEIKLTASQSGV